VRDSERPVVVGRGTPVRHDGPDLPRPVDEAVSATYVALNG